MDTKELLIFAKIAAYNSITRAAEELQMSQPAISTALRRLEEEVGCPLFIRRGKSLVLSEQGKRFAQIAEELATGYQHVSAGIRNPRRISREIRIDFCTHCGRLYSYMDEFRRREGDVCFILRERGGSVGEESSSDLSVIWAQDTGDRESLPLELCSSLYAVVSEKHPLAGKQLAEISDLQGMDFVFLLRPDGTGYESTYNECVNLGVVPRVSILTNSHVNKFAAIRRGCGIGLVYGNELSIAPRLSDCRVIPLNARLTARVICAAWREDILSEPGRRFVEFLRSAAK